LLLSSIYSSTKLAVFRIFKKYTAIAANNKTGPTVTPTQKKLSSASRPTLIS